VGGGAVAGAAAEHAAGFAATGHASFAGDFLFG